MSSTIGVTSVPTTAATPGELLFSWADYLVFAISLAIPLAIGIFFYFYKRNEHSTEDFLVGNRSMNFVAVALSILASLLNGVFVIGTPAEIHYYGTEISLTVVGLLIAVVISAHTFIPKYQTMKFTSAYEWVEKRFNYATRVVASAVFCLSVIIFLAIVLYVPALAFAQVTHLNIYVTVVVTGVICTVYTTIGGIKAVVWTDAVQMIILLVGLIAVAIMGSIKAGGGAEVWRIAQETGRVLYDEFDPDPRVRHTFWTMTIGNGFTYVILFISNQMMVQRYMAVSSPWKAQAALYIALLMFLPLVILIVFIGLALHAAYYKCDPLITKTISTGDQIMPYYIMDVLGSNPGAAGLLTASVFAAALSSVSSVINALSAVFLEDFICPAVKHFKGVTLSDNIRRKIAIVIVIVFGAITIGLSFVASSFTSKIVQATSTIWGVIGGPLAGVFIMGFYMPFCNSTGAISGIISGLIFSLWICVGSIVHTPQPTTLPVGICKGNITIILPLPESNPHTDPLMELYKISYTWYGLIGVCTCVIVGVIVSLLTGGWRRSHMASLDLDTMNIGCCRKYLRSNQVIIKESVSECSSITTVETTGSYHKLVTPTLTQEEKPANGVHGGAVEQSGSHPASVDGTTGKQPYVFANGKAPERSSIGHV